MDKKVLSKILIFFFVTLYSEKKLPSFKLILRKESKKYIFNEAVIIDRGDFVLKVFNGTIHENLKFYESIVLILSCKFRY